MVCLALALYELYHWDYDQIMEAIREFNRQLIRIYYGETYDDLKADLKNKTEIEFLLTRKAGEEFWCMRKDREM